MSGLAVRYDRIEDAVRGWRPSTWLLGLVVSLCGWNVGFGVPTPGLDLSWWGGLYMAAHDGMQYGTEVVFTFGPLGFLKFPFLWYDGLASLAFVYSVGVTFAFICLLIWTLRPRFGAPLACAITFLLTALVPVELPLGLAVLWGYAVLSPSPPRRSLGALVTLGAVFAAAECLMKLSTGPVITAILVIALIGARPTRRQVATFGAIFVGSLIALWLITGQSLGNIPDFAVNSLRVAAGYNEAMATYHSYPWLIVIMAVGAVLTVGWTWIAGMELDRRSRVAGTAIAVVVGAAMFKQGVVRLDPSHVSIYFASLVVIWIGVPSPVRFGYLKLVGFVLITVASLHVFPQAAGTNNLDIYGNLAQAKDEIRTLVSSSRKQQLTDQSRSYMRERYAVSQAVLDDLEGHTVSIDPWEVGAAWAYDLDWSPLPVFQNYTAYTPELDQLNVDEIASADGPERILRSGRNFYPTQRFIQTDGPPALDERNPNWDPPGQAIATLCNFEPTVTEGDWQALARVPDRCGPEILSDEVEGEFGEAVEVPEPAPDEVVFAKIRGTGARGLEKLRALLFKLPRRSATLSDGASYRLLPATAEDGLLLRSGERVGDSDDNFSQVPETETIRIDGGEGDLEFDFYRMKVRPAPEPAANDR